ncbi:cytochrome P450 [Collybia nuda]|uniref:Cytochrome P450 n=1 Tax=Collybia nuda TaxID=64659 RepID=A0A9P5YBT9_9AGAR|nr:cytochrome P450 [Collybia nuda]
MENLVPAALFILPIAFLFKIFLDLGSRDAHLPRGPPTRWLIGNAHVFPSSHPHLTFSEWAREYGDVMSLKIFHKTIIILNSPTAIREIIDKRNISSSNRPSMVIGKRLIPNDTNFGMAQFADENWKIHRKAVAGLLHHDNFKRYAELQTAESHQLMWDLYHSPDRWFEHIHRFVVSFASIIVYGKRSPRLESLDVTQFLTVHPQFMEAMNIATVVPVDLFPILEYVPEVFAKWKRQVKNVRGMHEALYGRLLDEVQGRLKLGAGNGCFLEDIINRADDLGINTREQLLNLGGVLLQGSDTSSAALQNLVFCLVCYPEAQEKAFQEVERVVGSDRAPRCDDLPNLPYIRALVEECNRLRPVDPLALPHSMNQDEVIDGVLYPKGATIFMNIWGIMHDKRFFKDPDDFEPERFIKHPLGVRLDVEDDPARRANLMFGGGRRVCPGIAFAQSSLGINAANFIWTFRFLPHQDSSGKEVFPDMSNYTTGVTSNPKPTKIRIVPRSQKRMDIIERCFGETARIFAPFEQELSSDDLIFNKTNRDCF